NVVQLSTFTRNRAIGGTGGFAPLSGFSSNAGPGGEAQGGGLWSSGDASLVLDSVSIMVVNMAQGGTGGNRADIAGTGGRARGGGAWISGSAIATITITGASDVSGNLADAGNGGVSTQGGDGGTA